MPTKWNGFSKLGRDLQIPSSKFRWAMLPSVFLQGLKQWTSQFPIFKVTETKAGTRPEHFESRRRTNQLTAPAGRLIRPLEMRVAKAVSSVETNPNIYPFGRSFYALSTLKLDIPNRHCHLSTSLNTKSANRRNPQLPLLATCCIILSSISCVLHCFVCILPHLAWPLLNRRVVQGPLCHGHLVYFAARNPKQPIATKKEVAT